MIELVFIACMSLTPDTCEERKLIYTDLTPMACAMAAQPYLATWIDTHPDWTVERWKCQVMRKERAA